jgi:branched-chain amino acid transport system ATP-binding protein
MVVVSANENKKRHSLGLLMNPKLLILDEPSLGLAPILVDQVETIIRQLKEERITILLVEQNARMALRIAHQGYVLETGSIALQGPASDLIDNEHVKAAYLGV